MATSTDQSRAGIDGGFEGGTLGDSSHSRETIHGRHVIQHSPNDHGRMHRTEHAPHGMNADSVSGSALEQGQHKREPFLPSSPLQEHGQLYGRRRGGQVGHGGG